VRRFLLVLLSALVLVPASHAAVLLGVAGDAARFEALTGQRSSVGHVFLGWGQGYTWGRQFEVWFPMLDPVPMIGFGTKGLGGGEYITPAGIANGRGDPYLIDLNREAARWGGPMYVRPMAEMNGHWNYYCAFNSNGTRRNAAHSQGNFRNAFRRIYLIMHGGSKATIDWRLAKWGMPPLRSAGDLPAIPYPQMRVLWNPQGYGSPDVAGNSAQAYYPGDNFVDVVGNDLYDIRFNAEWEANEKLYAAHPTKPYGIGEWGLWGIDDPAFVRRMANFVKTHRRVQVIVFYKSQRTSTTFDIGWKPRSRAAYRAYITPLG
jgi:hypothetical protein